MSKPKSNGRSLYCATSKHELSPSLSFTKCVSPSTETQSATLINHQSRFDFWGIYNGTPAAGNFTCFDDSWEKNNENIVVEFHPTDDIIVMFVLMAYHFDVILDARITKRDQPTVTTLIRDDSCSIGWRNISTTYQYHISICMLDCSINIVNADTILHCMINRNAFSRLEEIQIRKCIQKGRVFRSMHTASTHYQQSHDDAYTLKALMHEGNIEWHLITPHE